MRKTLLIIAMAMMIFTSSAQNKVYDETIDPFEQIDQAVAKAKNENKFVVCQLGGNWCP